MNCIGGHTDRTAALYGTAEVGAKRGKEPHTHTKPTPPRFPSCMQQTVTTLLLHGRNSYNILQPGPDNT